MPRALHVVLVAVIAILAVPIAQLRTVSERITCCCPGPASCKCPDHAPGNPDGPSLLPCHKSRELATAPSPLELIVPPPTTIAAVVPAIAVVSYALTAPHPPPSPARPPAPS